MKKRFVVSLLMVTSVVVCALPSASHAQQPKLDIKVFGGGGATTYVSLLETGRERDTAAGWQVGFAARVRKRKAFLEIPFSFNRWTVGIDDPDLGNVAFQVNSFELPINLGYIPYKNSYFKLFLYGGYVNHFNTKIIADVPTVGTIKLRPKEVDLAIYQAIVRFGASFDLAMFNVDFNYSISLNSASKTSNRTAYHQLQLNLAYLF